MLHVVCCVCYVLMLFSVMDIAHNNNHNHHNNNNNINL